MTSLMPAPIVTHLILKDAQVLHVYSTREDLVEKVKRIAKDGDYFIDFVIDTPKGPQEITMTFDAVFIVGREHPLEQSEVPMQVIPTNGEDLVGDVVIG